MQSVSESNPLLHSMDISPAPFSFLILQVFCFLILMGLLAIAFRRSRGIYFFPSFWLVLGWIIFYIIPSIFFGGMLFDGLGESRYFYFSVVNIAPITIALWLIFSPSIQSLCTAGRQNGTSMDYRNAGILILFSLMVLSLWAVSVPWYCTPGWAFFHDPEKLLLAREVIGKLSGQPFLSRAIGVYVNVLVPLLVIFCAINFFKEIKKTDAASVFRAAVLFVLSIFFYSTIFITGAKSSVIPVLMISLIVVLLMPLGIGKKIALMSFACIFCVGSIYLFQLQITKPGSYVDKYSLGQCVKYFDACGEAAELIQSASQRDRTVIGDRDDVAWARLEIKEYCGIDVVTSKFKFNRIESYVSTKDILYGLIDRAFKVPLQVSAWYYLWTSEYGQPGWRAIPIASRFSGQVNFPVAVYQRYGVIYSGGDKTSTSTAPSSFLMTWPAFMGWWGLIAVISCIVLLDLMAFFVRIRMVGPLIYAFAGLMVMLAYHMINTDFFTALGSHGGLAALGVCLLLSSKLKILQMNFFKKLLH